MRLLPSRAGLYFLLAMCLFPRVGYLGVWGKLTAALDGMGLAVPSPKALRDLRRRIGAAPARRLFEFLAGPQGQPRTPGIMFGRYRKVSFDGCNSIKVPDTARNRAWLGKAYAPDGETGYPALHLMTLCETGTRALLGAGWQVALAGRREELLAEAAQATEAESWPEDAALVVPADVTSAASVAALFDAVNDRWGRLDLLVNNAGLFGPPAQVDELDLADWQRVVDTNLTGAFLCAHHAVKLMKAQAPRGGRIINNGSISAHVPRPNSVAYTATKHAITGLTKSTSLDGRKYDIACGQIDVGNALTEMTQRMQRGVPQANGTVIEEPTMDVQNVARAVVFMATVTPEANVQFLTVMATKMPFVGRG